MAMVFMLTFTIGDWLKETFVEEAIAWVSAGILNCLLYFQVNDILISLIVDGIVAGVGTILTFLPNIFILFLALAFLEDSGYMSRVAYVMDGIMGRLGLSGRAFIPMLLGFGCTVPAIMASRALENSRDRRKTILITPFMSCSARLPIYVVFSQMFFAEHAMLVAYSMYVLGIVVAFASLPLCLQLIDRKRKPTIILLIELPEYKAPNARSIAIYVWEKVKDYLTRAGTAIFVASIIMWGLLNLWADRCCAAGYGTKLRRYAGQMAGSGVRTRRSGLLADCGGTHCPVLPPKKWWYPAAVCCLASAISIRRPVWMTWWAFWPPWASALVNA